MSRLIIIKYGTIEKVTTDEGTDTAAENQTVVEVYSCSETVHKRLLLNRRNILSPARNGATGMSLASTYDAVATGISVVSESTVAQLVI